MRFSFGPLAQLEPSTNSALWDLCWSQSTVLPSYNGVCSVVVTTLRSNSGCNTQVKTWGWYESWGRKGMIQLVKHREYRRVSTVYIYTYVPWGSNEEYIWQTWGLLSKEHAPPVRHWLSYYMYEVIWNKEVVHGVASWWTPVCNKVDRYSCELGHFAPFLQQPVRS